MNNIDKKEGVYLMVFVASLTIVVMNVFIILFNTEGDNRCEVIIIVFFGVAALLHLIEYSYIKEIISAKNSGDKFGASLLIRQFKVVERIAQILVVALGPVYIGLLFLLNLTNTAISLFIKIVTGIVLLSVIVLILLYLFIPDKKDE